ncbi:TSUP family transporter [Aerococcus urinae]|uniref:TSUP family transporter n=1 Tax=Aerococcus urinae TaxID=1376 RepID=UPI002551B5D2|nr:TSUP family transporter [Aerococcus urinae]MDK6258781.1 TSUP family transporter [Aerococcus urinae]
MIIILIANTIGSISGMGGGVIIKPMLDFINIHSPKEISFFSSLAVFTMSIISTRTQIKNNNGKLQYQVHIYFKKSQCHAK